MHCQFRPVERLRCVNHACLEAFLARIRVALTTSAPCEFATEFSVCHACHNGCDREQDQCDDQCQREMPCVCLHVPLPMRGGALFQA